MVESKPTDSPYHPLPAERHAELCRVDLTFSDIERFAQYPVSTYASVLAEAGRLHIVVSGEVKPEYAIADTKSYLHSLASDIPPNACRAAQRELVEFGFAPSWASDFAETPGEDEELIAFFPGFPTENQRLIGILLGLISIEESDDELLTTLSEPDMASARNPMTSPEILNDLANHSGSYVKVAVAANSSTPPETLARLFEERIHWELNLIALARNPNTPETILWRLAKGDSPAIRRAVRRRSDSRPEWTELSRATLVWELGIWSSEAGEEHPQYYPPPTGFCHIVAVLYGIINRKQDIQTVSYHWNHRNRLAAALAPSEFLSQEVLIHLAGDSCSLIRAMARLRLDRPEETIVLMR